MKTTISLPPGGVDHFSAHLLFSQRRSSSSLHSSLQSVSSSSLSFLSALSHGCRYSFTSTTTMESLAVVESASLTGDGESIGEVLSNVQIFTAAGEAVMFKDLWDQKEGMAVVALLRHFGCPCCWELAATLKELKPRFDSAGVKLIAVGVGAADKARILAERLPFPSECLYADPDRKAYNVLGLYYGVGRTFFNPATTAKVFSRFESLKKAVKNYTISATTDDWSGILQQGGMFVFKGKSLLYARKDESSGDHAPLDDILNMCCTAQVA
ncbi:thioredoxin-like protein AAED1, chloroplastic [Aristolochia californica]|uniref:thioredoxin-like protein AAED1, chloroplastic n=1 Tax=Aristolochia californica TaxID=171875 RepID=UPI0035D98362